MLCNNDFSTLLFQSVQSGKELCHLYQCFQSAYFIEVEGHKALKGKMAVKEVEVTTLKANLKNVKEVEKKVDCELKLAQAAHTLALAVKD